MGLVFVDWLNNNEDRAYPVNEATSRLDVNGLELPNSIIADANIALPRSAGRYVYVSSVGITPSLVTLTLMASENGFCSNPSSSSLSGSSAFVPIGVVSIMRPVVRFQNYPVQAMYPGVGGWIAFGNGAVNLTQLTLRFASPAAAQLVDRAVRVYRDTPVLSLGSVDAMLALTGIVGVKGVSGQIVTSKSQRMIGGVLRDVGVIAIDTSQNAVSTLQSYAGPCGHRPQEGTCNATPVTAINNVTPDCNGNIDLEFEGEQIIGDTGDGEIIDFPIGLSQICPKTFVLNLNTSDTCKPSSSSQSSSSSSSERSSSSSFIPPPTPGYCEDFSSGLGELEALAFPGTWTVASSLLNPQPGYVGGQFVIDTARSMAIPAIGNTYIVESDIILGADQGQGHVILGYSNGNSFTVVGVCGNGSVAGYPNGFFFVGHKNSIPAPVGQIGLPGDTSYIIDSIYTPSAAIVAGDYRFIVQAYHPPSGVTVIYFKVTWGANVDRHFASQLVFNQSGFCGLGAVGSAGQTSFANFGINCDGSSSSL